MPRAGPSRGASNHQPFSGLLFFSPSFVLLLPSTPSCASESPVAVLQRSSMPINNNRSSVALTKRLLGPASGASR